MLYGKRSMAIRIEADTEFGTHWGKTDRNPKRTRYRLSL
jgi:hypothetical protein